MREILDGIVSGQGREDDLQILKEVADLMRKTSLCALGRTAVNPVLSTLYYYSDEYAAHIIEKRCPSLACKALVSYYIEPKDCIGCNLCKKNCPQGAIEGEEGSISVIDQSRCTRCGICFDVCPPKAKAITKVSGGLSNQRQKEVGRHDQIDSDNRRS
jgi:NADH-quinone oxidoreductase subunit F